MKQKCVEILIPRLSPLKWIRTTTLNGRGNQILELEKKRKPCPKLQIQQQIFMPAIVENYFVVFIRLETGDSTFCQPAVRRPSTDNKRSIQGFNLSLNVEQWMLKSKRICFFPKVLFYSAMPTDIREDVELILRTELRWWNAYIMVAMEETSNTWFTTTS